MPAESVPAIEIVRTRAELQPAIARHLGAKRRAPGAPSLGLVPTMGALHAGHRALAEAAAAQTLLEERRVMGKIVLVV